MKILQIINSLHTGGAEKLVVESAPLYQQQGFEVDVLMLNNTKTSLWQSLEAKSTGMVQGITRSSVYNPLLIFKIIPHLKNYDIVHAHLFPTLYWTVLAKWLSGSRTPIIYTEHNTQNKRRNHFILKYIDRIIYKKLTKIVTIAEEVDSSLKKHIDLPSTTFELINNGVNVHLISDAIPLSKLDFFSEKDQIMIQVSSFREQKDQPTLIKAMELLPDDFKLLLVGEGPLRNKNEALVKDLNLSPRVQFLGLRDDIPALLKMSDYIVLSSHHEGLSLSSIEGMAAGKPFIASDVPGLREIVKDHGILFRQGNHNELAKKIQELSQNSIYRDEVAVKCHERAKEFDINKMIDSYVVLYKQVSHA